MTGKTGRKIARLFQSLLGLGEILPTEKKKQIKNVVNIGGRTCSNTSSTETDRQDIEGEGGRKPLVADIKVPVCTAHTYIRKYQLVCVVRILARPSMYRDISIKISGLIWLLPRLNTYIRHGKHAYFECGKTKYKQYNAQFIVDWGKRTHRGTSWIQGTKKSMKSIAFIQKSFSESEQQKTGTIL